jgi:hypothetical protein
VHFNNTSDGVNAAVAFAQDRSRLDEQIYNLPAAFATQTLDHSLHQPRHGHRRPAVHHRRDRRRRARARNLRADARRPRPARLDAAPPPIPIRLPRAANDARFGGHLAVWRSIVASAVRRFFSRPTLSPPMRRGHRSGTALDMQWRASGSTRAASLGPVSRSTSPPTTHVRSSNSSRPKDMRSVPVI